MAFIVFLCLGFECVNDDCVRNGGLVEVVSHFLPEKIKEVVVGKLYELCSRTRFNFFLQFDLLSRRKVIKSYQSNKITNGVIIGLIKKNTFDAKILNLLKFHAYTD